MRILVLGFGSMGRRHVESVKRLGHQAGCFDPARAALDDTAVRWFGTEDASWDWRPGAVIIASPAKHHVLQLARALFRAKIPTFVEKPVAITPMTDDWWPGGDTPVTQVGYQMRFHEAAVVFKTALSEIGRPISARFYIGSDMSLWPGTDYADELLECSHEIDAARWVLGEAEIVGAVHVDRTWELLLRHASDCVTSVHACGREPNYRRFWEVIGEGATIRWDWGGGTVTIEGDAQRLGLPAHVLWRGSSSDALTRAYDTEIETFVSRAAGDSQQTQACTLRDGLRVVELCERARRAAQTSSLRGGDVRE